MSVQPNFVIRRDVLNYILNNLDNNKLFNSILDFDNNTVSDSRRGFIYETLCVILIASKSFDSLEFHSILENQFKTISNSEDLFNHCVESKAFGVADIILKTNDTFIPFSIKYNKNFIPKNSDILTIKNSFENSNFTIGFIVKDKKKVIKHRYQDLENGFKKEIDIINKNKLLFDENDVKNALKRFCSLYKNYKNNITGFIEFINTNYFQYTKNVLIKKLHQSLSIRRFIINFNNGELLHLIAQKPRSGKTILMLLMCKFLLEQTDGKYKKILIMNAIPDTISSFIKDLQNYCDFSNISYFNQDDFKKIPEDFCGIVFCSVQYLKINGPIKKKLLMDISFDAMIIDECHLGSSNDRTKNDILEKTECEEIRKSIGLTIFASGTPSKTKRFYKIKTTNTYGWDLLDEANMKSGNVEYMVAKHGELFMDCYNDAGLNMDYSTCPNQVLMKHTVPISLIKMIDNYNKKYNTHYGYTCYSLFELLKVMKDNKIVYDIDNGIGKFSICNTEDGKDILKGFLEMIISDNLMNQNTIMKEIEKVQTMNGSRKSTVENPLLFLVYLPTHTGNTKISLLQKTLKDFIEKNNLWTKYNIEYSNSNTDSGTTTEEYNEFIKTIMEKTKNDKKRGCILLLGSKGVTGITYKMCDVTISLDNGHNLDHQKQKNARALTEAEGKTVGINVDMNIQRTYSYVLDIIQNYKKCVKKNDNIEDILYYLYDTKIFIFNPQEFNYGKCIVENIKEYYKKKAVSIIDELKNITDKELLEDIECNDDLREIILEDWKIQKNSGHTDDASDYEGEQQDCPTGENEKTLVGSEPNTRTEEEQKQDEEELEVVIEMFNRTRELCRTFLIPLLALFSRIHNIYDFNEIIVNEKCKEKMIRILNDKKIDIKINNYNIFIKVMTTILNENEAIIEQIRDIYCNATPCLLRNFIEKHFIPSQEEKQKNAEIPTPVRLVDEMLEKIPEEFWKTPHKVLEPCCGKGNFALGIFDKFYKGLAELYEDEIERCKVIITECLYYADITELNVFITTEILKCHVQSYCGLEYEEWGFEFNSNVGNTLELDIKNKWCLEGFDAVIGNPPYNKNLYKKFTEFCINKCNYLLFVIPSTFTIGVSHQKFIETLKNNGLKYVVYLDKNRWNNKIDIETLYILCVKGYCEKIYINEISIERSEKIFNMDGIYLKILNKIKSFNKLQLYKGKNITLPHNNPIETENIKFTESKEHCNKLLSRLNGGKGEQIYYTNTFQEDKINGSKIIFPRGTGSYNSLSNLKKLNKPIVYSKITEENILLSTGIVYLKSKNFKEAEFIQWYIMYSKFCRFLFIKENKFSELTKGFVSIIPYIDYIENITIKNDNFIYNYFKFTEEEIKFIENIFV
jgi:hypothetical protein